MAILHTRYTALPSDTRFFLPKSNQYPFDPVSRKIIEALHARNWVVPGISVEFSDHGYGEAKYRKVHQIQASDFKLVFTRSEMYNVPDTRFWATAALERIHTRQEELRIYEDGSGSYLVYVGDNPSKDLKEGLMDVGYGGNPKETPRTYLTYKHSADPEGRNWNRRERNIFGVDYSLSDGTEPAASNPYLVNDTNEGKHHAAQGSEPTCYKTAEVYEKFRKWLEEDVLARIELSPIDPTVKLTSEPQIPYPATVGPFYTVVDKAEYDRIQKGLKDKNLLPLSHRYALPRGGPRLVAPIAHDNTIPEVARSFMMGFQTYSFTKPEFKKDEDVAIVEVAATSANNLFVVDMAPAVQYQQECFSKSGKSYFLKEDERHEYDRKTARTIVPLHEYKGGFEKPEVRAMEREFGFDEVRIVGVKGNSHEA